MDARVGRFEFGDPEKEPEAAGGCRIEWDETQVAVSPDSGPPIVFDFGDVDRFAEGDHEVALSLCGGRLLRLHHFGRAHESLASEMLEAYRARLLRCLLLGDLSEIERFTATVAVEGLAPLPPCAAEVRLFESNLAILPANAAGWHWRLADVDRIDFDSGRYAWILTAGGEQLVVSRLAKRTTEFGQTVGEAHAQVGRRSAKGLSALFPWLPPQALWRLAGEWREGRLASAASLGLVDTRLATALLDRAIRQQERPYLDGLVGWSGSEPWWAGYRLLRPEQASGSDSGEPVGDADLDAGDGEGGAPPVGPDGRGEAPLVPLFWFFVPIRSAPALDHPDLAAWEATSAGGRATYLFRLDAGLDCLNAGLVSLNFRREPIYLPDDRLASEPRLRHYAIGARRLPDLRAVRRAFVGRAIHDSPEAWRRRFEELVQSAI